MIAGTVHQTNNSGALEVIKYDDKYKVKVKFQHTNFVRFAGSSDIRTGQVKDPMHPRVAGVGFVGLGKYNPSLDSKCTEIYIVWRGMIERCYSKTRQVKCPTYVGCLVCCEWHNFQIFAKWYELNYTKGCHIDKDIKNDGNKIYSPDNCMFVTQQENTEKAHAKNYLFISPDGSCVEIYNLNLFCKNKNLTQQAMALVHSGKRGHHKGWRKA